MTNEERKQIADVAITGIADAWKNAMSSDGCERLPPLPIEGATILACVAIGVRAGENMIGERNLIAGAYAGRRLRNGHDNILIGAYTETPAPDTCGFVNIGGMCWWREAGEPAECPPPFDPSELEE